MKLVEYNDKGIPTRCNSSGCKDLSTHETLVDLSEKTKDYHTGYWCKEHGELKYAKYLERI